MPEVNLRRLDCTVLGKGPWRTIPGVSDRSILIRHRRSKYTHRVYYGTRTGRTQEDAERQATAPAGAVPTAAVAVRAALDTLSSSETL